MKRNNYKVAVESPSVEVLRIAIRLLNGDSCFGSTLRIKALNRVDARPSLELSPGWDNHEHHYEASPEGKLLAEEVALRDALRALVDCWIESGKVRGQGEFPRQRSLTAHVQTGPPRFRNESLLYIVQNQNADRVLRANANGEFTLTAGVVRPRARRSVELALGDKYWRAWDCASRFFVILVTSDNRFRIAKCRVCHRYSYLLRLPIQYKLGYTCRKCKSKQAAKAAVERGRLRKLKALHEAAVESYMSWCALGEEEKNEYRDAQEYIAEEANVAKFGKTRKWVTIWLKEIRNGKRLLINENGRDAKR